MDVIFIGINLEENLFKASYHRCMGEHQEDMTISEFLDEFVTNSESEDTIYFDLSVFISDNEKDGGMKQIRSSVGIRKDVLKSLRKRNLCVRHDIVSCLKHILIIAYGTDDSWDKIDDIYDDIVVQLP